jgi:uncharacterized protein (TIGR00297 family)
VQTVNPLIFVPIGLVLSTGIAALAYRRGSLARSGVAGAILTGTLHFGFGGPTWGVGLIAFFLTSSALSRYKEREKEPVARQYAKGGRRDFGQTLANGGLSAALAVAFNLHPTPWLFTAFVGALATVTGDTWATELGVLARRPPRLITTGRVVPPGTSGGITPFGTGAATLGGLVIGCVVWGLAATFSNGVASPWVPVIGLLGGLVGTLTDSLLGATAQAQYRDASGQITEKPGAIRVRGLPWMTNDAVNFLASLVGALAGIAVGWLSL